MSAHRRRAWRVWETAIGADSPPTAVNHGTVGCARRAGQSRPGGRAARGSASGGEGDDGRALRSGSDRIGGGGPRCCRSRELSDLRCEHARSFASRGRLATGPPGILEVRAATRAARVPRRACRRHHQHGGPEVLAGPGASGARAGTGQVLIDVRAAGVNFADTLARIGLYADAPKPPMVVGYEVAGTISAVGEGVDAARVGERVMAGTRFGGYASGRRAGRRRVRCPTGCRSSRAPRSPSTTRRRGRRSSATARCARASASSIHAAAGGVGIAGDAARQARRRGGPRHGVARQARRDPRDSASTTRSTTATTAGGDGLPPLDLILDAIGGRRSGAPTRCCAPAGGWSHSAPRRFHGREAQLRKRAAAGAARCCAAST